LTSVPLPPDVSSAARSAALGSLGALVQSPLARAAVKYWWVALPIAYAGWRSYQRQKAKGSVDPFAIALDVAPLVTLVGTLVIINQTLRDGYQAPPPPMAKRMPIAPDQPITDAEFTPGAPAAHLVTN
jgi:hypothetical protein